MKNPVVTTALKVSHVSKQFRLPHEKQTSLKGAFLNKIKGKKGYELQEAIKDVSFEVKQGEFFGIVGRNGSGKSTLLKCIAGVYTPNKGKIGINGKLVPFIELGVGFNPDLSGRDNVFLNGALLGFSRQQMEEMYDEIVEFAELEQFMDQKLKNYSSGMQVRLAFSIAIRSDADILLLDEVLAVGDEAFQRKCYEYFAQLKKAKKTVVLVTHDMASVRRFCDRAILIDSGEIIEEGSVPEVTNKYQELNRPQEVIGFVKDNDRPDFTENIEGKIETRVVKKGKPSKIFYPEDKFIEVENIITTKRDLDDVFFGFTIWKQNGELAYWYTTEFPHPSLGRLSKDTERRVVFKVQNIFGEGKYTIGVALKSNDRAKEYIVVDEIQTFEVAGHGHNGWMLHPNVEVVIE